MIPLIASVVLVYLATVRYLRYRRLHAVQARIRASGKEPSPSEAQSALQGALLYDMPFFTRLGAQVALLKTYGIPSISALLLKTGEFSTERKLTKRVTDTALLISTFISCPLEYSPTTTKSTPCLGPRSNIALARVNWLHRRYNISNDDMLHTLALFILEPMRLVARFDWRPYSPEEANCNFLMWKDIGQRMDIKGIPESLGELEEWSRQYESTHMVPSESSHQLANMALDYMSTRVPNIPGARSLVKDVFLCLLDDELRNAMMLPAPSKYAQTFVKTALAVRAFIVRNFMLPRFKPQGYIVVENPPYSIDSDGLMRLHTIVRRHYPWYYPVPTGWRHAFDWLFGLTKGNLYPGAVFKSEGYRLEELGPIRFEQHGHEEVMKEAQELYGAPIEKPWAR
ncbi:uncharacterized protein BT62DRAFT_908696 [Guyanagaster necrorhizus]|uniref:ER-bound oxygenase mpaB/mpaB'/Rubber oxygenase catalytic domain-containing protein n=1 Tax=Guyanagaster necrorhizus TaxID=856835 RepID=A0A9P7VIX5_9AGAR|nr:uncharacterized protein BT62DRAFT_908696 [Guyanagaster necrorhizus MCA 3950]KAG7441342.1 hypothetical protein BT62DRAFT_908696 [Guyanagaster necrorhizus MCA 3950]